MVAGILLVSCGAPAAPSASPDYQATIQLLLPTAEPTEPPAPTNTAQPTDTPVPTPTATSRPTYTPRPAPTRAGAGERQPAIPFQAALLDGATLSLPDTYGTPTLLAFWAPW